MLKDKNWNYGFRFWLIMVAALLFGALTVECSIAASNFLEEAFEPIAKQHHLLR